MVLYLDQQQHQHQHQTTSVCVGRMLNGEGGLHEGEAASGSANIAQSADRGCVRDWYYRPPCRDPLTDAAQLASVYCLCGTAGSRVQSVSLFTLLHHTGDFNRIYHYANIIQ